MISYRLLSAVIALISAYMYMKSSQYIQEEVDDGIKKVLSGWKVVVRQPALKYTRVTVGINANVDLIVRAVDLLKQLKVPPGDRIDHHRLDSLHQLQESFHFHFGRGAAAERTFIDPEGFVNIVNAANELERADWNMGGNAVLMAEKIAKDFPATDVRLIGPIGPRLLEMLTSYKNINIPEWSYHPEDEIHLIMEYAAGERWGVTLAPVANRYITANDETNSFMSHMEAFFGSFKPWKPELIIYSGVHLLENQEEPVWRKRLSSMIKAFNSVPESSVIHMEMASMANPIFMSEILENILPKLDALGLNEQELSFAAFSAGGPHFDLISAGNTPPIHKVVDILSWLMKKYGFSLHNPGSKLTRIHFHSLTYHIIAARPGFWLNLKAAVAAGARMAGKQACDDPLMQPHNFLLRIPTTFLFSSNEDYRGKAVTFNASEPVMYFDVGGVDFYFTPVLVCKKPVRTVGLGDAISSTALMYSHFNDNLLVYPRTANSNKQ